MARIAVIYYSATGNVHQLADAIAAGVSEGGAEVRLRRVAELAPERRFSRTSSGPGTATRRRKTVEEAALDDLRWPDGFAFGRPVRFGNPAAQLKQFLDMAGGLWFDGALAEVS